MRELIIEIGEEAMRVGHDLGYPVEPIFGLTAADLAGSNRPAEKLFDTLVSRLLRRAMVQHPWQFSLPPAPWPLALF